MIKIEDYGYTDFDIIRENYCDYQLEDGTIIRTRAIILKILKRSQEFSINERSFASSFSPPKLRGQASSERLSEEDMKKISDAIIKPDIDILMTKERWSEYQLSTGQRLSIKAVLVSASLTDKYDDVGDPIYAVQLQILHKLSPNKETSMQEMK